MVGIPEGLPRLLYNTSALIPIVGNLAFSPGFSDPRFQELKGVERSQVQHFLTNGQWKTKQQIMDDRVLVGLSIWQKLQLAHFVGALPATGGFRMRFNFF